MISVYGVDSVAQVEFRERRDARCNVRYTDRPLEVRFIVKHLEVVKVGVSKKLTNNRAFVSVKEKLILTPKKEINNLVMYLTMQTTYYSLFYILVSTHRF